MFRFVITSMALWLVAAAAMAALGYGDWLNTITNKVLLPLVCALFILDVYNFIFHASVPNIRTAPAIRKKIIDLLKADYAARQPATYTILDLGSGNGLFTREIAAAMPEATVIGIERARQSVMWSNFCKRWQRLRNLNYVRANFLTYDFAKADAIVMYLIPPLMEPLGKKLHAEAKTGTVITSNKFRLGDGWEPVETIAIKTLYAHQGELHIYRK